jgi:glycerol-3-phosphate dehydrogenase (NAD(P)+)
MVRKFKIGVIGSGSWATALVYILTVKRYNINWLVRKQENINYIKEFKRNPNYLRDLELKVKRINFYTSAEELVNDSDVILLAIPSAFLLDTIKNIEPKIWRDKYIVSAIKGLLTDKNLSIFQYFTQELYVPKENIIVVAGPSHAEEIALERKTYLTLGTLNKRLGNRLCRMFRIKKFLHTRYTDDVLGIEYAAVLKNIYAIGIGMAHGMGYGDNFIAILFTRAAQETHDFLSKLHINDRNLLTSPYLGDLVVTTYSPFSRNRTFGAMIGKGYSVRAAQMEMSMIAEGYYNAKSIHEINQTLGADMAFAETVYKILYENASPRRLFAKLEDVLM